MALVPLENGKHFLREMHLPMQSFRIGGNNIQILQNYSSTGVAGCVWRSSVVLSEFFCGYPLLIRNRKVLELGAGTGLLGIICHKIGADVVSTDHANVILNAEKNFELNQINSKVHCKALNWGSDLKIFFEANKLQPPDVIIGADIIYIKETFHLLMKTLLDLKDTNPNARVYLACQIRYEKDNLFLHRIKEHFFMETVSHKYDDSIRIICLFSKA